MISFEYCPKIPLPWSENNTFDHNLIWLYLLTCHIFSSFHYTSRCAIYFPASATCGIKILWAILFVMLSTIMVMIMKTTITMISPSSAVRQLPPCLFCSFALGPSWPVRRDKYFYIIFTIIYIMCNIFLFCLYLIYMLYLHFHSYIRSILDLIIIYNYHPSKASYSDSVTARSSLWWLWWWWWTLDENDLTKTLILCMVAESPRGFLFRLAASIRSSSGSASISTIGLLFRP